MRNAVPPSPVRDGSGHVERLKPGIGGVCGGDVANHPKGDGGEGEEDGSHLHHRRVRVLQRLRTSDVLLPGH